MEAVDRTALLDDHVLELEADLLNAHGGHLAVLLAPLVEQRTLADEPLFGFVLPGLPGHGERQIRSTTTSVSSSSYSSPAQRLNTCFENEEMGILAGEVKNMMRDTQRGKGGWGGD